MELGEGLGDPPPPPKTSRPSSPCVIQKCHTKVEKESKYTKNSLLFGAGPLY